jgi:hypothetical protein
MRRRTEITIETERLMVLGKHGNYAISQRPYGWCPACSLHVEYLTTDEAALMTRVNSMSIFRWIQLGLLHYIETEEGLLLICRQSLTGMHHATGLSRGD